MSPEKIRFQGAKSPLQFFEKSGADSVFFLSGSNWTDGKTFNERGLQIHKPVRAALLLQSEDQQQQQQEEEQQTGMCAREEKTDLPDVDVPANIAFA